MIAAWMLYCLAVALAFVVVGHALERGLRFAGRPTRWAWVVALAGCFVVPAAAWLRPDAFATVSLPAATPAAVRLPTGGTAGPSAAPPAARPAGSPRAFAWSDLDGALRWGWGASSLAVVVLLAAAAIRLIALRWRWRAAVVDGRTVLVSENVGPAVAGLWPPRVIIPRWALALSAAQRRLMFAHEEEHVRAGDPWLLAGGTAAVAVAPWNLPLWWLLQRLRLAIEIDCDARVLGRGHHAHEYGELLLHVGHRVTGLPLGAAALGEPRSFLEQRIRRIVSRVPRRRWLGTAAALTVTAGAVIAACEVPRPVEPPAAQLSDAATLTQTLLRDAMARTLRTMQRADSVMAQAMRPWIRENLERLYPNLLREQSGPPVDILLGRDARRRVSHVAQLTGNANDVSGRIRATFPLFRSGNDAWGVVERHVLQGLVRENVRVIWLHLSASNGEVSPGNRMQSDWACHPTRLPPWSANICPSSSAGVTSVSTCG